MEGRRHVRTAIIGSGPSGLFAASAMAAFEDAEFVLISHSKATLGGYALWGDMKIGLPPAGDSTARWLSKGVYATLLSDFTNRFHAYLKPAAEFLVLPEAFHLGKDLTQKYYESYVLNRTDGQTLINTLASEMSNSLVYDELVDITFSREEYLITLKSGNSICCQSMLIASGRDARIMELLSNLGQKFVPETHPLIGCRATFSPETIENKINQLDLRIKDTSACQTYCFNYRGTLHRYVWSELTIFCGTLNPSGKMGNTFIGIESLPMADLLAYCKNQRQVTLHDLGPGTYYNRQTMIMIINFVKVLQNQLGFQFHEFYFPALERFWPRPVIREGSLKSLDLPNVFFVGEVSGISFGVLQCYATASYAVREMRDKEHAF